MTSLLGSTAAGRYPFLQLVEVCHHQELAALVHGPQSLQLYDPGQKVVEQEQEQEQTHVTLNS